MYINWIECAREDCVQVYSPSQSLEFFFSSFPFDCNEKIMKFKKKKKDS